jgi:hypothetical protein
VFLFRNDTPRSGHWFKLRLLNRHGSPAIGARAKVSAGGVTQMRELRSGSTYQSQNGLELHFGVGTASRIDLVEVLWPNGETTQHSDQTVDQTVVIRQPPVGRGNGGR